MDLLAKIRGIRYNPFLCRKLKIFDFGNLKEALSSCASFILKINGESQIAVSWWVSAKRTRSYPYARVYDTLSFSGKKITIIPFVKDEGRDGDRDFLQWDTVSLMSLLGIYVIIAYYSDASKSKRYKHKITNQCFMINDIEEQIINVLSYRSDALHWNISQVDKVGQIGEKALKAYMKISEKLAVEMHSSQTARKRIDELLKCRDEFMSLSRKLAEKAQRREQLTIQPKENLSGTKSRITICNYLGGCYYFTSDEVEIKGNKVFLVEGKHSKTNSLPSLEDIKDGLFKMILFNNLEEIEFDGKNYDSVGVLKLTIENNFSEESLSLSQREVLSTLREEARANNFCLEIG